MVNGEPGRLLIYEVADDAIRVVIKPVSVTKKFPFSPALIERDYGMPVVDIKEIDHKIAKTIGKLKLTITSDPLTLEINRLDGSLIQRIILTEKGTLSFLIGDHPVLGLGEGGPPLKNPIDWDNVAVEYDRRGRYYEMQPRWQRNIYGSRNPVAFLMGTGGYGLFVATPWVEVDLRDIFTGEFIPWKMDSTFSTPQSFSNQNEMQSKGKPPLDSLLPGVFDFFVFDAKDPKQLMKNISEISGQAVMPPKWALGYMQSHRTLEDDRQMVGIVDTFREKHIPIDAVIYLGTGFTPSGWNTKQPSFEFNPDVFKHNPKEVLDELHSLNVKVVMHMVPWDRDKIPYLYGSIPPKADEETGPGHIADYWQEHVKVMETGVDAWWPDEGDWFDLFERMKRHQMYYQGPVNTFGKRPWSLHRNGYLGIAKWGGWVWSGDTDSRWKSLQAQIAVGINHSLSVSPFWGFDIGGFFPSKELTGELYIRWFQFGAFVPLFRSHGQTWWTRLPWGWGLNERGPLESNTPPDVSALNDPSIEPIAKKYAELRYRLLPYNYTLAWQARESGMPMIRPLWMHYPSDSTSAAIADEYLWGRDMLIAPVYSKGAKQRTVYLPEGQWYDFWTGQEIRGGQRIVREIDLETMPIYVRAGALLPLDPVRQYTAQPIDGPTDLNIYSGVDGDFLLYDDDGISLKYLDGEYAVTRFHWDEHKKTLTINSEKKDFTPERHLFKVRLLPQNIMKEVDFKGENMEVVF